MSMDQDDPCLKTFEEAELIKPVDRKVYDDRIIYESRGLLMPKTPSLPQLCDLGEARFGQQSYNGILQPVPFRAPEVLLDMSWNSSVDIWNLALVTWQMLQGKLLFPTRDDRGAYSLAHHLASIVAILGPPPLDLVALNDVASQYFDKSGLWSAAAEVPQLTLESSIIKHEGEDTELFLDFMRRMLCWDPEERQSAR